MPNSTPAVATLTPARPDGSPMPTLSFADVVACLNLTEAGADTWTAPNLDIGYHRVFGGQILAQTIRVATDAAGDGKTVKSLTQLFPREGSADSPLTYTVTKHQEGKTFASTGVVIGQEKVVSVATLSLHVPEPGTLRQASMPTVDNPDDLDVTDMGMIAWDTRVVGNVDLSAPEAGPPTFQFWMRTPQLQNDDDAVHQGLLAYATDLTVIGTALRPEVGLSQADAGTKLHTAVTAHTMWFHQAFRVDDWLLVDQVSPVLAGSRAFGRGDVWTRDGQL